MTNIYNKGKYRSGEWAKHLRPFLKKAGNRRWRREANDLINSSIDNDYNDITPSRQSKQKKNIVVKFKMRSIGERTYTYKARYKTIKAAENAMKRANVINARIMD